MNIYRGRTRREFSLASALYDAIMDSDIRGVSVLIQKGADPNIVMQKTGISPFHLIIGNDSADFALKTTKLFLQRGGNPNVQSDDGLTPLHIAAAWGRIEIVELLLSCGSDPEIRDINYMLAIDYAIDYKHQEIIRLLYSAMYSDSPVFQNAQEEEAYCLLLEKIIVNKGDAEAEYEVNSAREDSASSPDLQQLPQTSPNEYVQNWCKVHGLATPSQAEPKALERGSKSSYDSFNFSHESERFEAPAMPFVTSRPRRRSQNVIENFSLSYEPSNKFKMRRAASEKDKGIDIPASFGKYTEASRESGILTLPDSTRDSSSVLSDLERYEDLHISKAERKKDTSSDYFTCLEVSRSANVLEENVFGASITSKEDETRGELNSVSQIDNTRNIPCIVSYLSDASAEAEQSGDSSFLSIAEVYKYTDNQEGIVLYEKRLLVQAKSDESNSQVQSLSSSKLSSLPASFEYDTEALRMELTQLGFTPGPITHTTKRVYLKKLRHLKKAPPVSTVSIIEEPNEKVYSKEIEKTLNNPSWSEDLIEYKGLEDAIGKDFINPDRSRKWREGINKSSFTYLLLDPRITKNLPNRAEFMSPSEVWRTFLSSIFYVGKGKRSRPYSHLYEATNLWNEGKNSNGNKKLQHIQSIWRDNFGVVCLHVFQNVIPVEAYTREAAMIKALKVDNIKNIRSGDFYGTASTWSSHQQRMLGVILLYKAMLIFLNEGERQLMPADIN